MRVLQIQRMLPIRQQLFHVTQRFTRTGAMVSLLLLGKQLEELELMQKFKSSKAEFDRLTKREEAKEKMRKLRLARPEYADQQIERQKQRELKQIIERIRKYLDEFFEHVKIGLVKTVYDDGSEIK